MSKMSESTSNLQRISNMPEIMDLVKLLRQNGDKVLSASSKLSLSTTLLYNLNEAFSLIVDDDEDLKSSFQVCNSSKIDLFRDLKFLHDFVQKTIGLKLTHYSTANAKIHVDITKFRSLKYLELKKVSINLVKGIQGIRGQLESITCAGRQGITTVAQLLATCGEDAGAGFVWGSLRHLSLSHNALERLDRSFELTPWLQILDLSHNLLNNAAELDCLPNLKYLNLGYNKLETVPAFNKSTMHSLQILVLKNNYIEDISGLEGLECLTEIDLSFNCLTEHSVLWPIERMSALLWLSLEGNPLSYHPKHRLLSIKYLHPCLIDNKFVLDHWPLSKSEKMLVEDNRVFPIRNMQSSVVSRDNFVSLSNSTTSNNTFSSGDSFVSKDFLINTPQTSNTSTRGETSFTALGKSRKKTNVKEAIITEEDQEKKDSVNKSEVLSSSHLETKKQILALREKFGKVNWLSSQAGSFVQDIMGLQSPSPTINYLVDTNSTLSEDNLDITSLIENKDSNHTNSENLSNPVVVNCNDNGNSDKVEETDDNKVSDKEVSNNDDLTTTLENPPEVNPLFDLELEKSDLYLVQNRKNSNEMEELFLELTADDIKERDTTSGIVRNSWSVASVLSCVLGRGEEPMVDIIFDTKRKDKQNRRYFIELEDAKKIVSVINEKMSAHPILLKVYKCMKCSTHFSDDEEHAAIILRSAIGMKQLKCPTCTSTLVIEMNEFSEMHSKNEETLTHKNNKSIEMSEIINLQHSESTSSIGSATSLEESRESTPSISAIIKKYESDIEILSNPSQSSIEVLDEASKANLTPNRKKSSEERSASVAPSLLTITDTIGPAMVGLTESSSSGSLTDSICTAYENRNVKKSNNTEINSEKESVPVANISTMLGELLQSIKIGSNKSLPIKTEEEISSLNSNVQYSYTDFSSVDHRVKLHIILNVFEHESEELALLLRADILMQGQKEIFPGCLVLSTSKVYILKIDGPEGEDPQRWLHKECSWTIDKLRSIAALPFKQGVLVELQQPTKMNEEYVNISLLCILQDFQRTSNFLFYITDPPLPASCEVEFSVPEHCSTLMHNLLSDIKKDENSDDTVRILALFSSAVLKCHNNTVMTKYSGLLITASTLVILEDNMQWLLPNTKVVPVVLKEQTMSNLMGIERCDTMLVLNFLNEIAGSEETWSLEFISVGAAEAVINSIQSPWEELFSVPLQVTTKSILDNDKS
ncbi:PREDICTED: serine/threonine-protein kinase 11-interacting protein isoform X2 [Polistes dominula]|uniref:Serine/threonine-protein kinase 11-interacting protein n=1 Tax=Polistes dominula TaxID=743375 RepID=A0ABM1IGE4_POLDO|nr:PREDICTED: serine/threonine-protein kinase 11-interacting protein isoform X2 [Polistes dominula]